MSKLVRIGIVIMFGVLADASSAHAQQAAKPHSPHWSYEGKDGPQSWGSLEGDFPECKLGGHQSPINIDTRNVAKADLPKLEFHYNASPLTIIDNGHTSW